ncbi:MAG: COQ9 family protein, partial [Pseudomonadota bacterium]
MTTTDKTPETTPSAEIRSRWLAALLPLVPEYGWTQMAARLAADAAEVSVGEQALAAPRGVDDLIEAFFDSAETEARRAIEATPLEEMRIHERVAFGIRSWLDTLAPHRKAVERASARGFWPTHAGDSVQRCWSVADMVWDAIGDTSEDYNRYTKRGLLAATIPPIILYWQSNPEGDDLDAFIARRLQMAMRLGQTGGRVVKPVLDLVFGAR